jgi:hypothetical protein
MAPHCVAEKGANAVAALSSGAPKGPSGRIMWVATIRAVGSIVGNQLECAMVSIRWSMYLLSKPCLLSKSNRVRVEV